MRPYLFFAVTGPLFMLLEVCMDLLQPRLMKDIIDIGLKNLDVSYITRMGLFMLAAAIVGLAGGIGCSIFSTTAGVSMGTDLRRDLYKKIQELPFSDIDKLSTGSLVTRLTNDIIQVQEISIMLLRILVRAPLLIAGSLIMAILLSPPLSLILVFIIPLLIISIVIIMKRSYPLFYTVQDRLDDLNVITQENLSGVRVIKAYVREQYEYKRFSQVNNKLMDIMIKASSTIALTFPIMIFLLNFGIAMVLYSGGYMVSDGGAFTTGKLMAFINYLMQLLMSLMMVSMILIRFTRAEASAKRIIEVLDIVPDLHDPVIVKRPDAICGNLVFDNVSFGYGKDGTERAALKNISFALQQGTTTGIIGTTGSGKSTLVNLIPRLYDVDSGKILLDGIDIREMSRKELRSCISVVPQQAILFSGTIRENIAFGYPDADDEAIMEAARTARILDFIQKSEKGLDTVLNQRGVNLSGGQKQRISIARALLPDPPVLILDESTSALDARTAFYLQESLRKIRQKKTTLIIGQRIASVKGADTIIVMDDGRIIDNAPHEVLLKRCNLYREIAESQDEVAYHE